MIIITIYKSKKACYNSANKRERKKSHKPKGGEADAGKVQPKA